MMIQPNLYIERIEFFGQIKYNTDKTNRREHPRWNILSPKYELMS